MQSTPCSTVNEQIFRMEIISAVLKSLVTTITQLSGKDSPALLHLYAEPNVSIML